MTSEKKSCYTVIYMQPNALFTHAQSNKKIALNLLIPKPYEDFSMTPRGELPF